MQTIDSIPAQVDRVPVADLLQQHKKTTLYVEYFKRLGITPFRDGLEAYITPEQANLVAQYHQAKGQGKEYLNKFLASLVPDLDSNSFVQNVHEQVQNLKSNRSERSELVLEHSFETTVLGMLQAIAQRFVPPLDPLARADALAKACRENLILRTSEVKQMVGVAPKGDRFLRDGFAFVRVGQWGREVSWRVERI
ncbi:MAG: hypothetical protein KME11_04830 [Timaviella obliquedivisa GSE-PSE-MK23-08B]|jgi:hypothetical protein|nr:hypothetical protein [Timaviella obliquedivisa GSE-PSE-MK23-08B]